MAVVGIELTIRLLLLIGSDERCLLFLPSFTLGTLGSSAKLSLTALFLIYLTQITATIVGIIEVLIVRLPESSRSP